MEVERKRGARVAFVGNSIQYFNDTPRFLTRLCRHAHSLLTDKPFNAFIKHQDSCFRGGTNLAELWQRGNGMLKHGYASEAAITGADEDGNSVYDVGALTVEDLLQHEWDFIVFNDHTQGPARKNTRDATIDVFVNKYIPAIAKSKAVPIIIETAAYRYEGINNSQDLGTTIEFQKKVRDGILCYIDVLNSELPSVRPKIAPVGAAFLHVQKENVGLWEQLFDSFDNFHPSPKGTFLQGCVLFYTMFGSSPPLPSTEKKIASLWKDARMMNPAGNGTKGYELMPLPTVDEAIYFCRVAELICAERLR